MSRPSDRRPPSVTALVVVLTFLGVTALGGGIEMLAFPSGNGALPLEMLDGVPFVDTFLVPGLVLGVGFGLGSLVAAVGVARRPALTWLAAVERWTGRHWSWLLVVLLGIGFAGWMLLEWAWLGTPWGGATPAERMTAWVLYGVYDTIAVALLVLPHLAAVRRHLARVVAVEVDPPGPGPATAGSGTAHVAGS